MNTESVTSGLVGEAPAEDPQIQPIDTEAIGKELDDFYREKSQDRRPYEYQWYRNAVGLRGGASGARWNALQTKLEIEKEPKHRQRVQINRLRAKFMAKIAKKLNTRPRAMVIPASTDREDVLDARYSEQFIAYLFRKLEFEEKYELVQGWAEITGKAFIWVRWDESKLARMKDPQSGEIIETNLGDVDMEVGPAFELLIDDPGLETLALQNRIMRIVAEPLEDFRQRHNVPDASPDADESELFQFQRQIADIGTAGQLIGGHTLTTRAAGMSKERDTQKFVLRKEMFWAPCAKYPKGAYAVKGGGKVVKYFEELPYDLASFSNPFPVEEFSAGHNPGQFWPSTMLESLLPVQENRDLIRSKMLEQLITGMHPKLFIPRNAKIPETAYNSEAGEKIYYNYIPGMPPPFILEPKGVSYDAWRMLEANDRELDEVSNIFPSSMGSAGDAESGFQTSLLQEAADAVYGPEKMRNERALRRLIEKLRHIAFLGYDTPRLLAVTDRGSMPSVFEFSNSNINPHAEIIVQIGSALPDQKAARLQAVLELKNSGLFASDSPRVRRNILSLVDLGGMEREIDPEAMDEERAQLENLNVSRGVRLMPPMPWDIHAIHVESHFDQMKSPDFDGWPEPQKIDLIRHVVLHCRTFNPQLGMEIAQMFGQQDLVQQLMPMLAPPPMPGGPPGPPGPPSPGPPPGPPM
jgi:hypothetical protein